MQREVHAFYQNSGLVVAISHAGDTSQGDPAGSLAAYRAAFDLGFRYFQIDVVKIRDDELVSGHAIIGRKPRWEDQSVESLRSNGHHVDRVADIIDALPDARWNLEIKSKVAEPGLTKLLRAQDRRAERFGVSAPFNRRILKRLRAEFGNDLCTNASLLEGSLIGVPLIPMKTQHADAMQVFFPLVRSRRILERNRSRGIQFQAWPVNDRARMERLLDRGVRGIITDDHQLLRDVLTARGEWADA